MRRPCKFKQSDLTRALKAAQKAGPDFCVKIEPDGSLLIINEPEKRFKQKPQKDRVCPGL